MDGGAQEFHVCVCVCHDVYLRLVCALFLPHRFFFRLSVLRGGEVVCYPVLHPIFIQKDTQIGQPLISMVDQSDR